MAKTKLDIRLEDTISVEDLMKNNNTKRDQNKKVSISEYNMVHIGKLLILYIINYILYILYILRNIDYHIKLPLF